MTDPVSIITTIGSAALTLKETIELLSQNRKDIYALASQLISETEDLRNLRKAHANDHASELDATLEILVGEFDTILVECDALVAKRHKQRLNRALVWPKKLYYAKSVERKITKLRRRIRDAQHKFLVTNVALQALDLKDMKTHTAQIQLDVKSLVHSAEHNPREANKIFGIDRMTNEQRGVALRKTTLDLSVTTKEETLFLIQLKIRTLKAAIDSGAPILANGSGQSEAAQGYGGAQPQDFFYDVNDNPAGAWQRQDALIETVSLLDVLQDPVSISSTPAVIWFIRANHLSESLLVLGLRKEALQLCTVAHDVVRKLAEGNHEFYRIHLAESLLTLSNCLSDTGKKEEALAAIQESVDIRRAATSAAANKDFLDRDLATSLTKLSARLHEMGRNEEALAVIQESVDIHRAHSKLDPASPNPDLASSLNNLSIYLSDLGRTEDAVAAIREAVEIRRALAKTNPGMYNVALARSLNNLSNRLTDIGEHEEALTTISESTVLYRALAEVNADAFGPGLAKSLYNFSICLAHRGDNDDALLTVRDAVAIYRKLGATNPDAFNIYVVNALYRMSHVLEDVGKQDDALAAIEEAVAVFRSLAGLHTGHVPINFADALYRLESCLRACGRVEEAQAVEAELTRIGGMDVQ